MQGKRDLSVDEASGTRYPIRFMQGGHLQDVPAPLVRVTTCGGFHLEVLQEVISVDPALGRYRVITLEQCPRGSSTGLTLLKMLASRPEHSASKDWLAEYIPRMRGNSDEEEGWGRGLVRIDNVVSLLRSLLCPPGIAQQDRARKMLVAYIKNHKDSGPGYQLASLPLLWLDIDVIAATVQQACQQEQDGHDALAAWEQVYALAAKGSYLPQEPYSDWASDKRAEIDGSLKQAVLALRRLLLARYGQAGEERVLVLLRNYWQTHPMDEDMLRPLMELLSKRECVQEALECYQRLCELLKEEGREPIERTQQTAHDVRTGQSKQTTIYTTKATLPLNTTSVFPFTQQDPSLPFIRQDFSENIVGLLSTPPLVSQDLAEARTEDQLGGEWLLSGASFLAPLVDRGWSVEAIVEALGIVLPVVKVIQMITRRSFLQTGATALIGGIPFFLKKHVLEEEWMQFCHAFYESMNAGWKLFTMARNSQVLAVSQAQLLLLHQIHPMLPIHEQAALYTSVYNFRGMALCHQGHYAHALQSHTNAYNAALGAGNTVGVTYSLLGQANSYNALGQFFIAIETLKQALGILSALEDQQYLHIHAHILGTWAHSAMMVGDYETARQKLDAVAAFLDDAGPHEEFDRSSWYQLSGKLAGLTGDHATAARWCEQALQEIPEEWTIRRVLALMPLLSAHAFMRDRDASLMILEKARGIISTMQAPIMNQPLRQALQGVLVVFPHETTVKSCVSELVQALG